MNEAIYPLDWAGISAGVPALVPAPAVSVGFFALDWTGIPCAPSTAAVPKRAGNALALDVRDLMALVMRREKEERELLRVKNALKLKQIATETTIRLAKREHEKKLKAARATYAVLLAEL